MKNFDEFVASREKMDPSTKKMSEHQWKQAYAAYCNSRNRVRKSSGSRRSDSSGDSSRQPSSRSKGKHQQSGLPAGNALRIQVREQTAYADLRLIVDVLAWVAIGVIIVKALIIMSMGVGAFGLLSSLFDGALGVVIAFVLKLLVQAIIDIPDIALLRAASETTQGPEASDSD